LRTRPCAEPSIRRGVYKRRVYFPISGKRPIWTDQRQGRMSKEPRTTRASLLLQAGKRHALDLYQKFGPADVGNRVNRRQLSQAFLASVTDGRVIFRPFDVNAGESQACKRRAEAGHAMRSEILLPNQGSDVVERLLGLLDHLARVACLRARDTRCTGNEYGCVGATGKYHRP